MIVDIFCCHDLGVPMIIRVYCHITEILDRPDLLGRFLGFTARYAYVCYVLTDWKSYINPLQPRFCHLDLQEASIGVLRVVDVFYHSYTVLYSEVLTHSRQI